MPKRRDAPLEERLRSWIRDYIPDHGDQKPFAKLIKRPEGWLTAYLQGSAHPDLDTTVTIAQATNPPLSAEQVTGLAPLPEPDKLTRDLLQQWRSIHPKHRPEIWPAIAIVFEPFLGTAPKTATHTRTAQSHSATKAAGSRTHRKRRAGGE